MIKRTAFLTCLLLAACGGGDDDDDTDPCAGLPTCTTAGAERCSGDATAVEHCATDGECLVWSVAQSCDATQACSTAGGAPACVAGCTDACPADGDLRCVGEVIEACGEGASGCLEWASATDCAATGQVCDETSGTPTCVAPCTDQCPAVDDVRCAGDLLETCAVGASGCLEWGLLDDCADNAPPQVCDDTVTPACVLACTDECGPVDATVCTLDDSVATCQLGVDGCLHPSVVDACDAVDEYCDAGAAPPVCATCVHACPALGDEQCAGAVVETCQADVNGCRGWVPSIDCATAVPPGICVLTGIDAACVAAELDCGDGVDNDGDTAIDCLDSDCAALPICQPYQGVFELWGEGMHVDLQGYALEFTPSASDPMGYTWAATSGVTAFAVTPGTGTVTSALVLGDDDSEEFVLSVMGSVTVYGAAYGSIWVGSNGYLTLGSSFTDWNPTVADLFAHPMVAAFYTDLDPTSAGTVTVDEFVDRVVVTFDDVVRYGATDPTDVQIVLQATGTITLSYVLVPAPASSRATLVGLAAGPGLDPYPAPTNYIPDPPEVCDDTVDNDWDGLADCADPDCAALPACIEVCDDGLDNDVDGATDCDDSDCFGGTSCAIELNCTDAQDNDLDTFVDCADPDCAAVPACGTRRAVFELFDIDPDVFDLEGRTLTFVPDAANPMGYSWTISAGAVGYLVTPGTGTLTTTLGLTDDSSVPYTLSVLASFPFYGTSYTSLYVGSNSHVTFGAGYSYAIDSASELYARPTIALLGEDLNPGVAGASVTADEFADSLVITYHNAPFYGETPLNQVQMILHSDGSIILHYVAVPALGWDTYDTCYVGVSAGDAAGASPAETNFQP